MKRRAPSIAAVVYALAAASAAHSAEPESYKVVDGFAIYLGVLPASMVQGHATRPEERMHDGVPRGPHAYHVLVALFDAVSGKRIEDAEVAARVRPHGMAAEQRALEPMAIAGTVTYGSYFTLGGSDPYRIAVAITPAGATKPVEVEFVYRHGVQ